VFFTFPPAHSMQISSPKDYPLPCSRTFEPVSTSS
jgi:hypothetical protein